MINKLEKIYSLMREEKYNLALLELEKLENKALLYPKVLVLKGICIFLSERDGKYTYRDVSRLYKEALLIDKEYVTALLELGHHYYASENKSNDAVPLFEKAIRILTDQLTDAVTGLAKCIDELNSSSDAINYLERVKVLTMDNKKINDLIDELKEK